MFPAFRMGVSRPRRNMSLHHNPGTDGLLRALPPPCYLVIMETGITPATRVNEILQDYPELTDRLMELGLCGCGYGPDHSLRWELRRAAAENNIDINALLDELNSLTG